MKHILILLLISFAVLTTNAQNQSFFTIGGGFPIFLGTRSDDPHYDYSINNRNYNLYLEKDLNVLKLFPEIKITPGLAYSRINESYKYDGLGGGGKGEYEHKAFSGYIKFLYEIDRQPYVVNDYYFGVQIGFYFNSKTEGSKSNWMYNPGGENLSGSETIDKSGKDFFHPIYVGIIAGIEPLGDKPTFIQPKIELAFYPGFATLNSYYLNGEELKSMIQISVSAGIGRTVKQQK